MGTLDGPPTGPIVGCCTVDGYVWVIHEGDRYMSVHHAATGTLSSRVDLMTDDPIAISRVGPRIWVATRSGKLFVFGSDGILLGVLQATSVPRVTKMFAIGDTHVVSIDGGKDFSLWDVSQFVVQRTFLGSVPGESVTCVVAAHRLHHAVIATSTAAIRLWLLDGSLLAEVAEGGVAAVALPGRATDDPAAAVCWVAQQGWITIFSLPTTRRTTQFRREKTIPAAMTLQLAVLDPQRQVCALDSEGLVTVWNTQTLLPDRSFKVASHLGLHLAASGASSLLCLPTVERRTLSLWCVGVGGTKTIVWEHHLTKDLHADGSRAESSGAAGEGATSDDAPSAEMEREEVRFLRKKLKYLESLATLYRQKVSVLFREKNLFVSASPGSGSANVRGSPTANRMSIGGSGGVSSAQMDAFNEIDRTFSKALEQWDQETEAEEPLPDASAQVAKLVSTDVMEFSEYWKRKYYLMVEEFAKMRKEHEGLMDLINEEQRVARTGASVDGGQVSTTLDSTRALFLTKIIREKNDLRERVMQLSDDVLKLRGLLKNQALGISGADSSLDAIDQLRQESQDLRRELLAARQEVEESRQQVAEAQQQAKQNQLLKQRVKKLKAELDISQLQLSEASSAMQHDVQRLTEALGIHEAALARHQAEAKRFDVTHAKAELEITELKTALERQKTLAETLQQELSQRERVEQDSLEHLRQELSLMCQSLDDRDSKITDLLQQNHTLLYRAQDAEATTKHLQSALSVKDQEIFSLHDRLSAVEAVVQDRKQYAKVVDELQGRLEMVAEELRHGFKPVQFTANLAELEGRISNLFALESQLRQKDDIIAMRDDEIAMLKEHLATMDKRIQQVSTIFTKLPRSVEEVEQLLVEVDEYRRRLGNDTETQEIIQLRLLELRARKQTDAQAPFVLMVEEHQNASDDVE